MQAAASLASSTALSQSQNSSNSYNGMPVSDEREFQNRIVVFVMMVMIKKMTISPNGFFFCTFDPDDR